jgi:hypothetical protein
VGVVRYARRIRYDDGLLPPPKVDSVLSSIAVRSLPAEVWRALLEKGTKSLVGVGGALTHRRGQCLCPESVIAGHVADAGQRGEVSWLVNGALPAIWIARARARASTAPAGVGMPELVRRIDDDAPADSQHLQTEASTLLMGSSASDNSPIWMTTTADRQPRHIGGSSPQVGELLLDLRERQDAPQTVARAVPPFGVLACRCEMRMVVAWGSASAATVRPRTPSDGRGFE